MQVQDYCKAMLAEVTAWKEKLEAMKKVADSYGTEQKQKVLPLIGQLEQEVANAQMRVQQLETECPSDWSPMKNASMSRWRSSHRSACSMRQQARFCKR